jgi:hypothetical protein
MAKVIFDNKTGQLLGAHLVGAEVTELIQGFVVAMNLETTEEELMHTIFPHPTISEMMNSCARRVREGGECVTSGFAAVWFPRKGARCATPRR